MPRLIWFLGLALALSPAAVESQRYVTSTLLCESGRTASVVLADLDGDADLDLVLGNGRHDPELSLVYNNDGHGNFGARRPLYDIPAPTYRALVGDLDGDRDADIVMANDIGHPGRILLNDGTGKFRATGLVGSGTYATRDIALGDLDGDADLDIAVVSNVFGRSFLYVNDGHGAFSERPLGPGNENRVAVALGDIDGDRDLDIAVGERGNQSVIYINGGAGTFDETRPFGGPKDITTALTLDDFNGDGHLDIAAGHEQAAPAVYLGDGKGGFGDAIALGTAATLTYAVVAADMDLDGDRDLVVGTWAPRTAFVDSTGDGKPDRWVDTWREDVSRVFVNDGRARFTEGEIFGSGGDRMRAIAVGDVDRDGDPDIVVGNDCQSNAVFFNPVRQPRK